MKRFLIARPVTRTPRRARLTLNGLEDRVVPTSHNPIVAENQLPGTPQSTWDVSGSGDQSVQGFATDISVNRGQTIQFKINNTANAPTNILIYRLGYYGGNGARLQATIPSAQVLRQNQPNPLTNAATGLIDAGNWAVSASWAVPATAVSGIYLARVTRTDNGGASLIPFIVRDDDGRSDLLFQTSDSTWQAYNTWGGNSLYQGNLDGRSYKVSYNRPFNTRTSTPSGRDFLFGAEYPMVRFLEANGYNVSYFTDVDSDRRGAEILEHKAFLSVGHDEYWSGQQRANVEAARDAGVNLAFFSGNEVYWKTRWENSIDASGTPYRTLVSYKETFNDAKIDPLPTVWTGTWRDYRFSPPADGGRPENALTGTIFTVNRGPGGETGTPFSVPADFANLRFWRNTTVANLQPGQTASVGNAVLGYEWDEDLDNGSRPAGLIRLSSTTQNVPEKIDEFGHRTTAPGVATHNLTLYRAPSGALVFGAGTIQWSWGLDAGHDGVATTPDVRIQQATVNLFADMGVQPATLRSGLVAASASTDATKPTSTITSPAAGTLLQVGTPVTITGTAADAGGGVVGGVEVSTDGGATWHPAVGRTSWTYTWTPNSSGATTIRSRAADDSANVETPAAGVTVSVSGANTLMAAYGFDAGSGTALTDASGRGNTGTIANATWTTAGKYGSALTFNGTNSWVTVADANSLDLTGAMTLEAWVYPTAINGWETVLMKEDGTEESYGLYGDDNGNDVGGPRRPAVFVRQGTTYSSTTGSAQLALNTWTHLATTYDGTTLRFYVNGTQTGSAPRSGLINTSTGPLRLGGNSIWGEYFNGRIDEVRVYNRALTAAEVAGDMNTPVAAPDTQPPTAPASLTATGGLGTVALSWPAATDNVGVARYNLHRSSTAGFTPSAANRIAQPAGTSYTDNGLAAGTWYYLVTAEDAAGNVGPASPQASAVVTADTTAPTVAMTAPADGAAVAGTVSATATASDNIGVVGVQFLLDGNPLGAEDTAAPYAVSWTSTTATNGPHTLAAQARDAAGNVTTSALVNVTVDNAAPTVAVTAPAGGATVNGSVDVTADAADNVGVAGVQFKLDGVNLGAEDTAAPYAVTWDTTAATNGAHTLTAVARDTAGNATTSAVVSVTVFNPDAVPPTVSVTAPANNATVSGSVNVTASASDNVGVIGVQFLLDGVNLGAEDTASPYAVTWDTRTAVNGTHTLTAVARDAAGNATTSATVTVTVNNDVTPPTVSVTAPANNATLSGSVNVTADAADNVGVAGVQFKLDGVNLGAEDTAAPYSVSWATTGATNGTHTLTAVARDAAGNSTTSSTVTVTVANTATGLVGAWGFEEGSGTTTADVSGNALNGTLTNAAWSTAGRYGRALSFNGTNALVTVADNALLDLTGALTLEAWVRATSTSAWRTILLKEAGTDESYAIYGNDDGNRPGGWVFVNGTYASARGTARLTNNTWTHLATTYDGTSLKLYVNGNLVRTTAATGNIPASTGALRIGGNTIWGEYFNGLIDEVRVYNVARTAAQITTDMNTPVGGGGGSQLADRPPIVPDEAPPGLSDEQVSSALVSALDLWAAAGLPVDLLPPAGSVRVTVADLPGNGLGFTDAVAGHIWMDRDAAGYGWVGTEGGFDLGTVMAHEVGHLLGIEDRPADPSRPADLMDQTLAPGEVRRPSIFDVRLALAMADGELKPVPAALSGPPVVGNAAVDFTGLDLFADRARPVARIEPSARSSGPVVAEPTRVGRLDPAAVGLSDLVARSDERPEKEWWTAEPLDLGE